MYILPNATAFNNACASADRQIATKCEVYVGGSLYATMLGDGINGEIISMEWDNIVCSNDGVQIGTCCMDEFKMTYRKVSTSVSLMGKEIRPYVGVDISGTVTYVPLGVFYVTDVSSEDEDRTFNVTAYDGMQNLLADFNATTLGITFPINAWTLLNTIATHFGMTVDYRGDFWDLVTADDLNLNSVEPYQLQVGTALESNRRYSLPGAYEGTYRDYVGWIVGLVGAYAHMGRNGELVVSRYVDYGFDVERNVQHMGGSKINYGGSVTYTSIVSGTDENPIYPTNYGGNAITYTNPYMTVEILDNMCDQIIGQDGITVTPCDVTWRSNPCIDAGDIVGIEDKDGNMSSTYVMERVVSVTGGLVETLHCYGETEVMHTLNKSPISTKFAQVSQDIKDFAELINGTDGVFQFIDNGDGTNGGFTIYENGTSSWLRCTAGGIGISPDGGLTYTNAITKNGVVASQLNVVANGHDILEAKLSFAGYNNEYEVPYIRFKNARGNQALRIDYNDYFKSTTLALNDAVLGTTTSVAYMSVGRTGTMPSEGTGGYANINLSDPRTGHIGGVRMRLSYPDGDGYSDASFYISSDILGEHNFGRVGMQASAYESGGVLYDNAEMGLFDRLTGNARIIFYDSNDNPQIRVHQGTTYRFLVPTKVSINGTYYWILAEQTT